MAKSRLPAKQERMGMDSSLAIVNIVLLLIFFFLATGSIINSRTIEVALPETTVLPLDLLPSPLLAVSADGTTTLDGEPLEPGTLAEKLIDSPTLYVLADKELAASTLLDLLEAEALVAVAVRLVTIHSNAAAGGEGGS